jgi:hypothetical protein
VSDLERALTELGEHLDVGIDGNGANANWQDDLARRLAEPTPIHRRSRLHALVAAAAAIAVLAAGVVTVAPARSAVAGWLGIGAVEVSHGPPPWTSSPVSTTTRPPLDLDTAQRQLAFDITTPDGAGPPSRVAVDRGVPGGLLTLTYDDYTLVEIATDPSEPVISKFVDGGPIEQVAVHGHNGMWIPEAHSIGYIDRAGDLRSGTLRRSGPVLVWTVDDVTFRVEGPPTLDQAMAVANTVV